MVPAAFNRLPYAVSVRVAKYWNRFPDAIPWSAIHHKNAANTAKRLIFMDRAVISSHYRALLCAISRVWDGSHLCITDRLGFAVDMLPNLTLNNLKTGAYWHAKCDFACLSSSPITVRASGACEQLHGISLVTR